MRCFWPHVILATHIHTVQVLEREIRSFRVPDHPNHFMHASMRPRVNPPRLWMRSGVKLLGDTGIETRVKAFSHSIDCLTLLHSSFLFHCRPQSYHKTVRFDGPLWCDHFGKYICEIHHCRPPLRHVELCSVPYHTRQHVDTAQIPPREWTMQGSQGPCASSACIVTPEEEEVHETARLARICL